MENGKNPTRLSIIRTTVAWTAGKTAAVLPAVVTKQPVYADTASISTVLMFILK